MKSELGEDVAMMTQAEKDELMNKVAKGRILEASFIRKRLVHINQKAYLNASQQEERIGLKQRLVELDAVLGRSPSQ